MSRDVAPAPPGFRPPWRAWAGPVVTVVLAAGVQLLLAPLWAVQVMSLARYDASGRGGPFRACGRHHVDRGVRARQAA